MSRHSVGTNQPPLQKSLKMGKEKIHVNVVGVYLILSIDQTLQLSSLQSLGTSIPENPPPPVT